MGRRIGKEGREEHWAGRDGGGRSGKRREDWEEEGGEARSEGREKHGKARSEGRE